MKLVIILFLFCSFSIHAQLKQKMADQLFEQMAYSECVEMYNELASKSLKKRTKINVENIRRAAICNFYLFRMAEAIHYFEILRDRNLRNEKDIEFVIKAQRFIGDYESSKEQIDKSSNDFPTNIFFQTLKENEDKFNQLFVDSAYNHIRQTRIESQYGDFAPTYFQDGVIYASKSINAEVINGRYGWDNAYYVSLLQSPITVDTNIENGKLLRKHFESKAHDGPVDFNVTEDEYVITKNIFGKRKGKAVITLALYFSKKQEDGSWSDLTPFPFNNPDYNVGHGCFSTDGNTLYFSSDKPDGYGGTDIYYSKRIGDNWAEPVNLGNIINTSQNELFPFLNGDILYFSSDGHFGLGGLDLFESNLKAKTITNLGYPINSSADDFALISDSSNSSGFFSSNRIDAIDRIYAFEKEEVYMDLVISVFEKYDVNEFIPEHPVTIQNKTTGLTEEYYTNHEGKLNIRVRPNEEYTFTTAEQDFKLFKEEQLQTANASRDTSFYRELLLLPTKITIALRVISKETKKPLDSATTIVTHLITGWDTTLVTNEHGLVTLNVDRNQNFWAFGSKKGYIDAEKGFNTSNEDGKIIELQLELTPIKKGEKFKLENIFYDLAKANLRPESMAALDKLADFIIKNDLKIELSAHTDSRGSVTSNQKLSQARAQSCVDYLLTKGVKSNQIIAKGYGESQLVNRCKDGVKCSEEEHQENRRTEVKILDY